MEWFVRAFLKASLSWLGLAVTLGVAMALHPPWVIYRTAHLHMALLGFVAMMIFGVAYHVIPRFTGHPLHDRRLARIHFWLANAGLAALVAGFLTRPHLGATVAPLLAAGGVLAASGAYAFIFNIWRTIDGERVARVISVEGVRPG
jgi:cytochrome c oxidase cbb3-type subunit 1